MSTAVEDKAASVLGAVDAATFLAEYWQQRPLLIRTAIGGFVDPLQPGDLFELAGDEAVESRIVLESGGAAPWELREGPFDAGDIRSLPASHWTLLVQDVEKHRPELWSLLHRFRFIPDWRIDDLMVSYASPHGSVGPHWDEYDVFLLQGRGRRHWRIDRRPVADDNRIAEAELRIMRDFQATDDWLLEPGDMLYLPPRIAHFGVAVNACQTYSIGFRAPGHQELATAFLDDLISTIDPDTRYRDEGLSTQDNPGRIDGRAIAQVLDILRSELSGWGQDRPAVAAWFGRFITETKTGFEPDPPPAEFTAIGLQAHLSGGAVLRRHPATRFAFVNDNDVADGGKREAQPVSAGAATLFVDGQEWRLGANEAWFAELVCRQTLFNSGMLEPVLACAAPAAVLLDLVNEGYLIADAATDT